MKLLILATCGLPNSLFLKDDGKGGGGTSNPGAAMHITTAVDGAWASFVSNTDSSNSNGVEINAGNDENDTALKIANRDGTSEFLRVLGSGNVGIGTSNPSEKLDATGNIRSASGSNSLTLDVDGSNSANAGLWSDGSHLVLGSKTTNDLNIFLNDAETLQITRGASKVTYTSHGGSGSHAFAGDVSATGSLDISGAQTVNVTAVSDGTHAVAATDYVLSCDSAGGTIAITLPAASSVGRVLHVVDATGSASTNAITINRAGSDTIQGDTSLAISSDYAAATLVNSAAGKWSIL